MQYKQKSPANISASVLLQKVMFSSILLLQDRCDGRQRRVDLTEEQGYTSSVPGGLQRHA